MEEEYEQRITDLKADLAKLRGSLAEVENRNRGNERERQGLYLLNKYETKERQHRHWDSISWPPKLFLLLFKGLISQLSEQNQRLTSELESASKREEELTKRLEELRVQFNDKRTSMRDHVTHLENLKQEVNNFFYILLWLSQQSLAYFYTVAKGRRRRWSLSRLASSAYVVTLGTKSQTVLYQIKIFQVSVSSFFRRRNFFFSLSSFLRPVIETAAESKRQRRQQQQCIVKTEKISQSLFPKKLQQLYYIVALAVAL